MSVSVRKDNTSIMETVTKYGAFSFKLLPEDIALITIDVEGERVNTLKAEFIGQIEALLLHAQQQQLQGMVFVSAKPGSFIAGADIIMLDACTSAQQASELAQQGQRIFSRIAALPIPVVAAIEGACLGGGLELALACHYRICADDDKTVLGLPEVQLGLLPGSGGTQRLPSLIGIPKTLELILSGRQVKGKEALRIGLVDEVVPAVILLEAAIACIRQGQSRRFVCSWQDRLLQSALGRAVLWRSVTKKTHNKTLGNYPAANKIIEVIRCGVEQGSAKGYEAEAKVFGELVMTSQSEALRSLFFATNGLKKERGGETDSINLRNVGVLGGGLMGGGIAYVTAIRAGLPVRIKDVSQQGINYALGYSWEILSKRVKARRMRSAERQKQMQRLSGTLNYSGFAKADVVIEAVFEDLSLKQQMVAEVEAHGAAHTVFASNTSSLPIAQIAAKARYPERVVGLHYFSPVDKMPLVEVIPHQGSSESSIATILALAQRQGKTAIVVADRPGFYVNRILTPYMAEAARCLLEGAKIDAIDNALLKAGFPVGPFGLLDEVGIDVGTKIIPILVEEFGERFSVPAVFDVLLQDNRKGRKNGRGFYCYSKKWFQRGKKSVDDSVYQLLGVKVQSSVDAKLIAERCMMLMLNEAARCLAEDVIRCARDGDIGAVFGIGFPPFLGGPFRYMDRLGIDNLVQRLNVLQQRYGAHFAPSEVLLKMQQQGQRFYP